jgi:hypothetical protein
VELPNIRRKNDIFSPQHDVWNAAGKRSAFYTGKPERMFCGWTKKRKRKVDLCLVMTCH